ncbi:MAG: hypothetical protein EOM74_02705, partial [Methanomicrobia archaeon]|nr:hypothetical protein [Methanomicrobia archaeon]
MKSLNPIKKIERYSDFKLLLEGGNAVTARRITKAEVVEILDSAKEKLFPKVNIELDKNAFLVGSAGKKETSGDIDIIIQSQDPKTEVLRYDSLVQDLGYQTKVTNGIAHEVSVSYPIPNTHDFCQLDIMLCKDIDFCLWALSVDSNSQYKAFYRNALLSDALKCTTRTIDKEDSEGNVLEETKCVLRWANGCYK